MSHYMTALAMRQTGLKPATKIVLYWLADHHNESTGECYPSIARLADLAEMSRRAVSDHLTELLEKGLIAVAPRFGENKARSSNGYTLNFSDTPPAKSAHPPMQNLHGGSAKSAHPPMQNLHSNLGMFNLGNEKEPLPVEKDRFDDFWAAYPNGKRKTDQPKARKLFYVIIQGRHKDIPKTDADTIINGAKGYAATDPDPLYIPLPTTWLNGARWNATPLPPTNGPSGGSPMRGADYAAGGVYR